MRANDVPRNIAQAVSDSVAIAADPDALVSIEAVAAMVGLSKRTVRQMVTDGKFPEPVHINRRVVRWVMADIREWIHARKAGMALPNIVQAARAIGTTFPIRNLSK